MPSITRGKVTWFNKAKGFGEIVSSGGEVFFFTYADLQTKGKFKSIERDTSVEFTLDSKTKFGLKRALCVRPVRIVSRVSPSKQIEIPL